ncbi:MAG: hypothetical protein NE328_05110 [Lentisphaeraceae bacterium]|nr:hypothetical protein [Lentisphaeraceae bacterium]
MKKRYVTATDKNSWNGNVQVVGLNGVDEDGNEFSVTCERASKEIRQHLSEYYLWDGKEKYIRLMSVASYVEAMEYDECLNLQSM